MKDLFVPYEIALKLKELGFDEECLGWYAKDIVPRNVNGVFIGKHFSTSYKIGCYAPLYQQAFKFFREKYKLEIDFTFHTDYLKSGDKNVYEICIQDYTFDKSYLITPLNGYKTYEEAELEAIKHLIKICCK